MNLGEKRDADSVEMREKARASKSEEQPEHGAENRKDEAFRQHLANEAALASSERGADGDFLLAGSGTSEKKVGEIGADDEHDDANGTSKDHESRAKASADVIRKRSERGRDIISLGMFARDLFGEDGEFRLSAPGVCAGLEATDDGESVTPAIGFRTEWKRGKEIDAGAGSENGGEIERSGENTDDGDRSVVENKQATNDPGIGSETALPKAVTQKDDSRSIPLAFIGAE